MRILYCNPIALDYRIPFYKQLNKLCDGEFYFLFSSNRYKLTGREKLMQRFIDALGSNAIIYKINFEQLLNITLLVYINRIFLCGCASAYVKIRKVTQKTEKHKE